MAEALQTERRFAQLEFDVVQVRAALYADISDMSRLKPRVDWLLIIAIFGSTASLVLSLISFVLILVK